MSFDSMHAKQGESNLGAERRVSPPVVELDDSYEDMEGNLVVLYGTEESGAIQMFDEDASSLQDRASRELAETADSDSETAVSAELSYHGKTVVDLSLDADSSFGAAVAPYNGGDLDEMGFKVEESAEGPDLEYRIVAVPPTLDAGEADAMAAIPEDVTDSAVSTADSQELCGTVLAGVGVGLVVGHTLGDGFSMDENLAEIDGSVDSEVGASVDELLESA